MQNFQPVDKIINFSHKAFHKNDLAKANAHVSEFSWKCLHLGKIVQLHSCGKVQKHVGQIRALVGELVENRVRNKLYGQLDVSQ